LGGSLVFFSPALFSVFVVSLALFSVLGGTGLDGSLAFFSVFGGTALDDSLFVGTIGFPFFVVKTIRFGGVLG